MSSLRPSRDENAPTNARDGVRDEILSSHAKILNARADAFDDYRAATQGAERATPTRARTALEILEREHGRARASALGDVDHVTPVLTPGGALGRRETTRTSPWIERVAYARAHPYASPPRRLGLFDEFVGASGRDRALGGAGATTSFGREARREAREPAWRLTPSAFGRARETSGLDNRAIVYRGYGETTMGATQSAAMRDRSMEKDRAFGGAATFKRFDRVNIFGEALKKYVSMKKWDDADGLSTYKALIASYESGTLAGRAQRLALEAKRDERANARAKPEDSLAAKHAATLRSMQETLRIRREKLSYALSSSTASGLEDQLERLSVEAREHKARREREKAAKKFLKPLTRAQLDAVDDALHAPSSEILASATFVGQGALEATGKDIATLRRGTWLNDEVANFAIGLLARRELQNMPEGETQPKAHFFSTFFINKLYKQTGRYDYSNVRRWTLPKKLKYDVLRCEKIYVPVHQEVHWVLAVIDVREKTISYYDSLLGESSVAVKNLKRWIVDEAKNKLGEDWDPDEWSEDYPKDIPLQMNGCDCGVFMLKYAEYLSAGAELAFDQKHMEYFRKRLVSDILAVGIQ